MATNMVLLPNFLLNKIEIRNFVDTNEMNLISSRLSYSVDMYTDKTIIDEYCCAYVQNLWIPNMLVHMHV